MKLIAHVNPVDDRPGYVFAVAFLDGTEVGTVRYTHNALTIQSGFGATMVAAIASEFSIWYSNYLALVLLYGLIDVQYIIDPTLAASRDSMKVLRESA